MTQQISDFKRFLYNSNHPIITYLKNILIAIRALAPPVEVTLLSAGLNYQKEGAFLNKWLSTSQLQKREDVLFISFSHAILPFLYNELPVIFWRDYLSQKDELRFFEEAYQGIDKLFEHITQQSDGPLETFSNAVYHCWARELFNVISLCEVSEKRNPSFSQMIAIIDNPFNDDNLFSKLPSHWNYRFLGDEMEIYPYKEVVRKDDEVINVRKKIFKEEQMKLGDLSALADKPSPSKKPAILVLVDDSESEVNLTSTYQIIRNLSEGGAYPVVMTSLPSVRESLNSVVEQVFLVPEELHPTAYTHFAEALETLYSIVEKFEANPKRDVFWKLFFSTLKPRIYGYLKQVVSIEKSVENICDTFEIKAAIAVGEGNFFPAAAITRLNQKGIETIGFSPILYMHHPMCSHWPAKHHLVYGHQAVEVMTEKRISPETITVVGSEHFDRCLQRNREKDRRYIYRLYPEAENKKLVVIATEARARQMLEIEPSVRSLVKEDLVFTVIKLHPSDRPGEFEHLFEQLGRPDNLVVAEKMDVHALANMCDLLITMGSNLIIEAGVMGTPSLVYNFSGTPCPIDFVAEGLCFGAYTLEEFEQKVTQLLFNDHVRSQAMEKLKNISRYNGPNDGKSAQRISRFALKLAEQG